MNSDQNLAALRSLLTAVGPLLVTFGVFKADQVGLLIETVMTLAGAISTIVGVAWSWWAHSHDSQMEAAKRSILAEPAKAQPVVQALREVGADVNTSMMSKT